MENSIIKKLRLEFCFIFIWAAVIIGLFEWDGGGGEDKKVKG